MQGLFSIFQEKLKTFNFYEKLHIFQNMSKQNNTQLNCLLTQAVFQGRPILL